MKNVWRALKTLALWAISLVGIIISLAVFFDSIQIVAKIFAALLFIVSVYILPVISKLSKLKIKKTYIILTFLVASIGSIIFYGTETEAKIDDNTYYCTTDKLNVRNGGGKEFNVAFQIDKGDEITIIGEGENWSEIECSKGKGFVSNEFISKDNSDKNIDWLAYVIVFIIIITTLFTKSGKEALKKSFAINTSSSEPNSSSKSSKYICKYCGTKNENLRFLIAGNCPHSSTGKHVVFEGGIQSVYICEWCGTKNENLRFLTAGNCPKSPTGKHQPFIGGIKKTYICKYCGTKNENLRFLTAGNCPKSPTKNHHPTI